MGVRPNPSRRRPLAMLPGTVIALVVALVASTTSCGGGDRSGDAFPVPTPATIVDTTIAATTTTTTTTTAAGTTTTTSSTTTSSTTTTTAVPETATAPPTSAPAPSNTVEPLPNPWMLASGAAFDSLARANPAASMTIVRDGVTVFRQATGHSIDGAVATSDSPMVIASVSKLITAAAIARLAQDGAVDLAAPVPWASLGIDPHPAWDDVTPRELLDHTSGMPVARSSWFTGDGTCWTYLPTLLSAPPQGHRGRWTYSNGNYCALGLLVGAVTGATLDDAAQRLLFDPVGANGVHLTDGGQRPTDVAYALGVERLSRLGGAGAFIASTDDLATMLAALSPADRAVMSWPGVLVDQYGWGHTGTIDGAKSCAWMLESNRTVVVATVAGGTPATGGGVCDRIVPAVAADLELPASGRPERTPP